MLPLLLLILCCGFFLVSVRKPFWAANIIIFLLPAYLWRFKIAGLPTNFLEALVIIFALSWWPKNIFQYNGQSRLFFSKQNHVFALTSSSWRKLPEKNLLFAGSFLIIAGASLSLVVSPNLFASLGILKSWIILPVLFAVTLFSVVTQETFYVQQKSILTLLRTLALSGGSVGLVALGYYLSHHLTYDGRLRAFYGHPNQLAMYLAPSWIIIYGFCLRQKTKKAQLLWFIALIALSVPLLLTFSYGAWAGILGGSFALVWGLHKTNAKTPQKKPFYLYGGFVLLVLWLIVAALTSPKLHVIFSNHRSSLYSRIMIWRSALFILKNHWITGIGPGQFQTYYLNYQKYFPSYLEWAVPQPHNIFLAFWLQAGLIGLVGFLSLVAWFFQGALKTIQQNKKRAFVPFVLIAIMVYTLIHGLIDTTYWKNDLSMVWWLIIALMSITSHLAYLQKTENPHCR